MLWSDNRACGTGRRQRTRRSGCRLGVDTRPCGRWRTAPGGPTSLSGIVRLGSGRYGTLGWTPAQRPARRPTEIPCRYCGSVFLARGVTRYYCGGVCSTLAGAHCPGCGRPLKDLRCSHYAVVREAVRLARTFGQASPHRLAGRTRATLLHDRSLSRTFFPLSPRWPHRGAEAVGIVKILTSVVKLTHNRSGKRPSSKCKNASPPYGGEFKHPPGCRDAIRRTGWAADGARRRADRLRDGIQDGGGCAVDRTDHHDGSGRRGFRSEGKARALRPGERRGCLQLHSREARRDGRGDRRSAGGARVRAESDPAYHARGSRPRSGP